MNKNTNPMNDIINAYTEKFGDRNVQMAFRDVMEVRDHLFDLIEKSYELVSLIRQEEDLKKRHRAYLHVREEILDCCKEINQINFDILMMCKEGKKFHYVPKGQEVCDDHPFADTEGGEETVTIPKEQYDSMIEDLLTMAEMIDMVCDMRTQDIDFIQQIATVMPVYAEYEASRLALYREVSKEAEDIFTRWDEEYDGENDEDYDDYDEDDEPDEYFSD